MTLTCKKNNVFNDFLIGWDKTLNDILYSSKSNFPPQNIALLEDGSTEIQLALAGYKKEDLEITLDNDLLKISYKKPENSQEDKHYVSRQIAKRSFKTTFVINRGHEVKSASMENGLLTILISPITPKKDAPKLIHID